MTAASITAVLGATGTGKSYWINRRFLKPTPKRLLVWSHKPDYERFAPQCADLGEVIRGLSAKSFKLNFRPSWDNATRAGQFDLFCRAALSAQSKPDGTPDNSKPRLTVIVEELHMVTSPSWAPGPWQQLSCIGRAYGVELVGTSQRPAHMDKDFLSNCTDIVGFRVNERNAQKTLAEALGVPLDEVRLLPNYHFIHRDNGKNTLIRG